MNLTSKIPFFVRIETISFHLRWIYGMLSYGIQIHPFLIFLDHEANVLVHLKCDRSMQICIVRTHSRNYHAMSIAEKHSLMGTHALVDKILSD